MQFSSLGSGSRGNSTLIESDGTALLVDCGFSMRETEKRLQRLSRDIKQVSAILVTHEHGDHVRGVASLAKKHNIPVWSSRGTAKAANLDELTQWNCIDIHQQFAIDSIQIQPVPVPHDAREPCQFVFGDGTCSTVDNDGDGALFIRGRRKKGHRKQQYQKHRVDNFDNNRIL